MTLLDILSLFGFDMKKVAATNGGEYAGPCPFCGGKDRYRVWPLMGNHQGRYWCRQCNRTGDSIQFLKEYKNMTFVEALTYLNKEVSMKIINIPTNHSFKPKERSEPNEIWMGKATSFIQLSHKRLLQNEPQLNFLLDRGNSYESICKAQLGWNPLDIYLTRISWGLENNGKKLWIPKGIVIPYIISKKPLRIRIRRPEGESKYCLIPGSNTKPMIIGHGKTVTIVESELDGILVHQEAADLTSIVALGSAQIKPDVDAHEILRNADLILGALDNDIAGKKAKIWWQNTYPRFLRWPVITGKDPGEAYQKGMPIRLWIEAGINEARKSGYTLYQETTSGETL